MEQKKPTKKQLEKKLREATVFVDKAEKSIYLADIGVGIYISKFERYYLLISIDTFGKISIA